MKMKHVTINIYHYIKSTRVPVCLPVCLGAVTPGVCVCVFGDSPIPMSSQLPPAPGSAQQLQGCSLQQWCPYTTYYLEGFSLSRCYSGRNGVKLRCIERLDSIGFLSLSPAIHDFLTELHQ